MQRYIAFLDILGFRKLIQKTELGELTRRLVPLSNTRNLRNASEKFLRIAVQPTPTQNIVRFTALAFLTPLYSRQKTIQEIH